MKILPIFTSSILVIAAASCQMDSAQSADDLRASLVLSSPDSVGGVTPFTVEGGSHGGNVRCNEIGYAHSSARVNYHDGHFDAAFPAGITVEVKNGTYVSWRSTFGIGAVIVKGGPAANIYEYEPASFGDRGLASPKNSSHKPAALSNLTFCWNDVPQGDIQTGTALNHDPVVTNVFYPESKFDGSCSGVEICVQATDADNDPLEYQIDGLPFETCVLSPFAYSDEQAATCSRVQCSTNGTYEPVIQVFDLGSDGARLEDILNAHGSSGDGGSHGELRSLIHVDGCPS
jgi:hypothetical protein